MPACGFCDTARGPVKKWRGAARFVAADLDVTPMHALGKTHAESFYDGLFGCVAPGEKLDAPPPVKRRTVAQLSAREQQRRDARMFAKTHEAIDVENIDTDFHAFSRSGEARCRESSGASAVGAAPTRHARHDSASSNTRSAALHR